MLIGRLSQMSPPPCLYDTVIQSYVQLKSGFKSMGQLWDALAPQGCKFYPIVWYVLTEPSASSNVANFHFYEIHSLSYESVNLVAKVVDQGLLGRGQCVLRWFRIGCLLPRVKRAHPHVSMTLLSWDIPLISFNGSLWDVLLGALNGC